MPDERRTAAYNVLSRNGAPPQFVARVLQELDDEGVFNSLDVHIVEPSTTVAFARVRDLIVEFESSKSPAIRGAGKKLRAALESPA